MICITRQPSTAARMWLAPFTSITLMVLMAPSVRFTGRSVYRTGVSPRRRFRLIYQAKPGYQQS
jgi:hypothetical protein